MNPHYIVPEWSLFDDDIKQYLINQSLTAFAKWCTVEQGESYYSARRKLVDHIVETNFIQVQATNVLHYWVDFMDTLSIDLSDNRRKRRLWYDVVYLLTDWHYDLGLHRLVRQIMIENYARNLEVDDGQ